MTHAGPIAPIPLGHSSNYPDVRSSQTPPSAVPLVAAPEYPRWKQQPCLSLLRDDTTAHIVRIPLLGTLRALFGLDQRIFHVAMPFALWPPIVPPDRICVIIAESGREHNWREHIYAQLMQRRWDWRFIDWSPPKTCGGVCCLRGCLSPCARLN